MKKNLLMLILFHMTFMVMALPGFNKLIEDKSGDYLFYRDFSFSRESYIGILYYDESRLQIKYYAPADIKGKLPEKEISLLISINPDLPNLDLTGELVMSAITPNGNDVDIINYLHDILYEFSARRIKAGNIQYPSADFNKNQAFTKTGHSIRQDYKQFGGMVTIYFDDIIPLFNIKSIYSDDGNLLLCCCAIGHLKDNADASFNGFKGFGKKPAATEKKSVIKKSSEATEYTVKEHQIISLDSNWTQSMENLWLLGNEGLITITELPAPAADDFANGAVIIRKLLESTSGSYTDLSECQISGDSKKHAYLFSQLTYQPNTENWIRNKRIITKKTDGFYYFTLTVFESFYLKNKAYYDDICKSYRIK